MIKKHLTKPLFLLIGLLLFQEGYGQLKESKYYLGISAFRQNTLTLMTGDTYDGGPYNSWKKVNGFGGFVGYKLTRKISLEGAFHTSEMVNAYSIFDNNHVTLLPEEGRFADLRWKSTELSITGSYRLIKILKMSLGATLSYHYFARGDFKSDTSLFDLRVEHIESSNETMSYHITKPFAREIDGHGLSSGFWINRQFGNFIQIQYELKWVSGIRPVASTTMLATRQNPNDPNSRWLQHNASSNNSGFRSGIKIKFLIPNRERSES